jgi:hypothetical protein
MRLGVRARGVALALVVGALFAGLAPAGAYARRPTKLPTPAKAKGKLGPAPDCEAFEGSVAGLVGVPRTTTVTHFGSHGSTCVWTGQQAGNYAFVVSVAVFGAPAEIGTKLLAAARLGAARANATKGGLGLVASKSPKRGNYFEGEAIYSLEEPDKETDQCTPNVNGEGGEAGQKTAIEPEQTAPTCAGQPGTEGDFLTAYGSPIGRGARGAIEPMVLQISVACQLDAFSGGVIQLSHIASAVYGGRGY